MFMFPSSGNCSICGAEIALLYFVFFYFHRGIKPFIFFSLILYRKACLLFWHFICFLCFLFQLLTKKVSSCSLECKLLLFSYLSFKLMFIFQTSFMNLFFLLIYKCYVINYLYIISLESPQQTI